MPRTEEQIAAGDALTEAIERLTRAYGYHEDGDVNGSWVCVVEQQSLPSDEEEFVNSSYALLMKGGRLSTMTVVGMLETACFDAKLRQHDE